MGKLTHTLRSLTSFVGPFAGYWLSGRVTPVLAGYKITHRCNLRCVHCPYWSRNCPEQDFPGVVLTLRRLRDMGVRILILEGGEPLIWRDGQRDIRDVIHEAKKLFPSVCMTTNGTLSWRGLPLDRVWVSLDGPESINDALRGPGVFRQALKNIEGESGGRAFVSTTINTCNVESIPELLAILSGKVQGVTIQFYYPYQGLPDPLFIAPEKRIGVLSQLMDLKKQGLPVANSYRSLADLRRNPWTCEDRLLANAEPDGTILHGCYLKNRGPANCELCGFAAHNEMSLAFAGVVDSIRTGMQIFFR